MFKSNTPRYDRAEAPFIPTSAVTGAPPLLTLHGAGGPRRWLLVGVVALGMAGDIGAAAPPASSPVALDHRGQPLPQGAVRRIGDTRWATNGSLRYFTFCLGGKCLLLPGSPTEIMDIETGLIVRTFPYEIEHYLVSADGRWALGRGDGEKPLDIWDLASGKVIRRFPATQYAYGRQAALSHDGKFIAACREKKVEVRAVASGKLIHSFSGFHDCPDYPIFSPDGRWLAVGECRESELSQRRPDPDPKEVGRSYHVHVFALATGKLAHRFQGCPREASPHRFSADGGRLLLLADYFKMRDLGTGKLVTEDIIDEVRHGDALSGDLRLAARCDGDERLARTAEPKDVAGRRLHFTDLTTGKRVHRWTEKLPWPHWVRGLALSPDGKTLAVSGWRGEPAIRLFDVATGKRLNHPEREGLGTLASALSPDGHTLATLSGDGTVRLWGVGTGRRIREIDVPRMGAGHLAFCPDGKSLALAGGGGKEGAVIRLFDPASGKERAVSPPTGVSMDSPLPDPRPSRLCWSPDSRAVALWGQDDPPRVWDVAADKLSAPLAEPVPSGVAFTPDGKALLRVGGSLGRAVRRHTPPRLSDWRTGEALAAPPSPGEGGVLFAWYAPDVSRLLLAGEKRILALDAASYRTLHDSEFYASSDTAAVVSGDGRFVATRTRNGPHWTVHEAATGQSVRTLSHPGGAVLAVYFHPDGRHAVSTGSDGRALVWDLSTPPGMPVLTPGPTDTPGWRRCWEDLGDKAHLADRRAWGMAAQTREAVRLIASRLKPAPKRDRTRVVALIHRLGSDDGDEREAAEKALAALGQDARPELQEATKSTDAEVKRRATRLLAALDPEKADPPETPDARAARRAILVLERIATHEAARLLKALAGGDPVAPTTREAAAAVKRLEGRR